MGDTKEKGVVHRRLVGQNNTQRKEKGKKRNKLTDHPNSVVNLKASKCLCLRWNSTIILRALAPVQR
ncbi:hypothetical protein PR202_ga21951 [Eleusine coracana subsp. coracana]|uniref:40S ribosomal protein S30 n=1 Tax=Eleusine coracana subsp. coracana TaxID=191504 RepID=A0AAV5D1A9_ELECO|nr:hypothetical protein PR202_ga21951 [Eleusine coracana subsp. coracana]